MSNELIDFRAEWTSAGGDTLSSAYTDTLTACYETLESCSLTLSALPEQTYAIVLFAKMNGIMKLLLLRHLLPLLAR